LVSTRWLRHCRRDAFIVTTFALAACGTVNAAEVRGSVTDESGFPLPGAVVTAKALPSGADIFQTKCGKDGTFVLAAIPFGQYRLEASLAGFVTVGYEPVAIRQLAFRWNFKLPLGPSAEGEVFSRARVVGTLRNGDTRIANASVCLSRGGRRVCTATNQIGEYELWVEPGRYTVEVRANEKILWSRELDFPVAREYRDPIRL
jgi:hypothetical protein